MIFTWEIMNNEYYLVDWNLSFPALVSVLVNFLSMYCVRLTGVEKDQRPRSKL
jgi:hypothetical protein